jgi:predicted component of type VI protein secretion system
MAKEEIRAKIAKNIKRFDLCALIKLLKSLGYQREQIVFEGNSSQVSHSNLCHEISFDEHRVRIVVNIGLLGSSSSLPSFFQELIEKEDINSEKFISFLNFFNHHLIDAFIQMTPAGDQ